MYSSLISSSISTISRVATATLPAYRWNQSCSFACRLIDFQVPSGISSFKCPGTTIGLRSPSFQYIRWSPLVLLCSHPAASKSSITVLTFFAISLKYLDVKHYAKVTIILLLRKFFGKKIQKKACFFWFWGKKAPTAETMGTQSSFKL